MPPRTRRSATTKPAAVEQDDADEEPVAKPVRRRRSAANTAPPQPEEVEDDEPVAKPRRRRLAAVEEPSAEAKPRRRTAAKPVVEEEEPDDGLTPNQRKMAKLRAMRKPKPEGEKKPAAPKRAPIQYGTGWLAEVVSEAIDRTVTSFDLRAVLRRLAAKGVLKREVGVERGRYEFTGPKDPTVLAVVKAYKSGEVDAEKKEKLAALAAKKAKPAAAKPARGRAKPAPEPVDEDEEYDDDDVDELDD